MTSVAETPARLGDESSESSEGLVAKKKARRDRAILISQRLGVLAAVMLAWEVAVASERLDPFWVSQPTAIWETLYRFFATGYIYEHLWATLKEAMVGLVVGSVAGVILGFALARFRTIARILDPFIYFIYSIPRIALAPLFVLWFGIGLASKVVTIVAIVFFLLLVNTMVGIRNVDQGHLRLMKAMGATRWQTTRMVTLPSTAVWILAGLRLAIPNSVIGAVIAEYVGATRGLGYIVLFAASNLDTTTVLSAIAVLGLISVVVSQVANQIERRLLRWQVQEARQ